MQDARRARKQVIREPCEEESFGGAVEDRLYGGRLKRARVRG